ncbi:MAG TPA: LysR family transcriptional regulator [Mycobacteriales bacterium]|nr:LysR family transcriptional regulator [Mycobacteriales bacterium]
MRETTLDLRRLRVLLELSQRGTMREVASATGYSPSAVSAQLAALERESGAQLLERVGRGVRLTPAGVRLAGHARDILGAVDAARADLAAGAEPAGRVRVASYASALEADCLPVARTLRATHPRVRLELQEREPAEAFAALLDGDVDLALVYDYALAPRPARAGVLTRQVTEVPMVLAVPADADPRVRGPQDLGLLRDEPWVVNSRGQDDDELAARLCSRAGFLPRVVHKADSLELVQALVAAGLGVALLPAFVPAHGDLRLVPLPGTGATRRMWTAVRPGNEHWPAVALVVRLVTEHARAAAAPAPT